MRRDISSEGKKKKAAFRGAIIKRQALRGAYFTVLGEKKRKSKARQRGKITRTEKQRAAGCGIKKDFGLSRKKRKALLHDC